MEKLLGKVAIVTGASSGIGAATARRLAANGARVILGARRADRLATLEREITASGGGAALLAGDVADEGYAEALVALAEQRFGGLDFAFNNAGALGDLGPAKDMSAESWRAAMDVNLTAGFLGAKHQSRALLRRGAGAILFASSFVGATVGFPGMAAYAASKAGLLGLIQVLAAELGPHGVRVNAILPGGTRTEMGAVSAPTPEAEAAVADLHALKRLAEPEEIANAAAFLLSPEASFVNGAAVFVDGGVSINRT